MINFLSFWVKNLSLALIVVSILEMILPNNKTKKYVKMVMGLYILFSIISPFIENKIEINFNNIDTYLEDIKQVSSEGTKVDQTSMDTRLNEIYKEQLQKDITEKIKNKGYEVENCSVKAHISENDNGIEKIVLNVKGKIENENDSVESSDTLEDRIVTEIQKIQKVDIKVSEYKEDEKEETNITNTDIRIIKNLLIQEYGVNEQCLKIN